MNEFASPPRQKLTLAELSSRIGMTSPWSDWMLIDQARVDAFAQATGDMAYIHVDPARAAQTRFGATIAHGLLLLSLLPAIHHAVNPVIHGRKMGVNYGYNRVRFITPVPVGSRIRARFSLQEIKRSNSGFYLLQYEATVELERAPRPAVTAEWILGAWIDETTPST